jgi:hypothetical protein
MPRVGFEPTTPVFVRAKTVQALDRTVTTSAHYMEYFMEIVSGSKIWAKTDYESDLKLLVLIFILLVS